MEQMDLIVLLGVVLGGFIAIGILISIVFRRVVQTNEVHIVQSAKKTISYGKDTGNGNSYYEWPSWVPLIGITKVKLPTSVFDLNLEDYEAYDKGRVPFVVDVKAFFRISDSNLAAQRIYSTAELLEQLKAIVQGSVRVILSTNEIQEILQGRATFGEQFTAEVKEQLANWGVSTVKNIELMDIRDSKDSSVIKNIMEKKKSYIEMESRTEVAKNMQIAQVAEIEAKREVRVKEQIANQSIGLKTIEVEKDLALNTENKLQEIKEQQKLTKTKEMEVIKVEEVKKAEIEKEVTIVKATQDSEAIIIKSQGELESTKLQSQAIKIEGEAKAEAEKLIQLAPVQAQISLAQEIGSNESYQKYLITIKQIEAGQAIGLEQAKALMQSEIKIIANSSNPSEGLTKVMDLFTSNGGTQIGAMLEGLSNSDSGKAFLDKILNKKDKSTQE
jgi:flotillin